jgi:hypothetical protein
MTAMEKVAWTELSVSLVTVAVVSALIPWLGTHANGAFGLLGCLVFGLWFVRRRGSSVVVDERDRDIERQATHLGVGTAWMALFLALIALVFWSSLFNDRVVPTQLLTWLIWIQFAICYGVKGFVAVLMYRRQKRAS